MSAEKPKKSKSVHGHQDDFDGIPDILKPRNAPSMESAPRNKYRIKEIIEELVKSNNRIYKGTSFFINSKLN